MQPFYITGLPRSRTSWLSVLFSDGRTTHCAHEPLARLHDYEPATVSNLLRKAGPQLTYSGLSDSGLAVVAPQLPAELPGGILIVVRDPEEVIESLAGYLGGDASTHAGGIAMMHAALIEFSRAYPHMTVGFEELADIDTVEAVWNYLVSGLPFPRLRAEELLRLRIDPVPGLLLEDVSEQAIQIAERAKAVCR